MSEPITCGRCGMTFPDAERLRGHSLAAPECATIADLRCLLAARAQTPAPPAEPALTERTVHLVSLQTVAEGLPHGPQRATVEDAIAEIAWLRTMAERIRAADAKFGHFAAKYSFARAADGSLLRSLTELASLVREAAKGGAA